jgi:hypothetical protein
MDDTGIALFVIGLLATVAAMALPLAYPNFPISAWRLLLWSGIGGMLAATVYLGASKFNPPRSLAAATMVIGVSIFVLGGIWFHVNKRSITPVAPTAVISEQDPRADNGLGADAQTQKHPAFDTSGSAELQVIDPYLQGVPNGLLRAGGNTKSVFKGLTYIDPSVTLTWPTPDTKYTKVANATLRRKAILLSAKLREINAERAEATRDMSLRIAGLTALAERADVKAEESFQAVRGKCLAIGAAIASRENLKVVPREPRNVYIGAEAIILGRLSGIDPILNSAIALEALAGSLK